jgi:hypothetical protein
MDTMVIGFREIEKFYNFAAYGPKVQTNPDKLTACRKVLVA